jgi:hypothetical protein
MNVLIVLLPLEPAMKPNISAFSGRVTLLDVLNISCASNICSLCKTQEITLNIIYQQLNIHLMKVCINTMACFTEASNLSLCTIYAPNEWAEKLILHCKSHSPSGYNEVSLTQCSDYEGTEGNYVSYLRPTTFE